MAVIQSFRELDVYKLAGREAKRLFLLSQRFAREEAYSLTDQIRRASRAVGAILAEAWARRRYRAAFVSKVVEAMGEAMEVKLGSTTAWHVATSANGSTATWMPCGSRSAGSCTG